MLTLREAKASRNPGFSIFPLLVKRLKVLSISLGDNAKYLNLCSCDVMMFSSLCSVCSSRVAQLHDPIFYYIIKLAVLMLFITILRLKRIVL